MITNYYIIIIIIIVFLIFLNYYIDNIDNKNNNKNKNKNKNNNINNNINKNNNNNINNNININKKIIIYASFNLHNITCGGCTVLIYFAQKINELYNDNIVSIYTSDSEVNDSGLIFNNFIMDEDFDIENTIVIYPEGQEENPLDAKYIVRWILADLNTNINIYKTWNDNDLVYYYNKEKKFYDYPDKVNNIYKQLSIIFLNSDFINYNDQPREGYCHTYRKSYFHSIINEIHPDDSFEITRDHSISETVSFFNKYKYFICYDPFTFLALIAILCGCIPIIYPMENYNKKEYLQLSPLWDYIEMNNINNFYGLAYGLDDVKYAENTLNQGPDFIKKGIDYVNDFYIKSFLKDINNIENLNNTVINNYGKTN